jgi:hypothetical protein
MAVKQGLLLQTRRQMTNGCKGIWHFFKESIPGDSSRTPIFNALREPNVDDNNESSNRKHVGHFIKTKIGDNIQYSLRNLTLEVEGEVSMNYGNEEQVLGDDEMTNINNKSHDEASCNADVVKLGVVTAEVVTSGVILRSRRYSRTSQ